MSKTKEKEIIIEGYSFIDFLIIIIQICFIPFIFGLMTNLLQIIIPVPVGGWLLISIIGNLMVYGFRFFESKLEVKISEGRSDANKFNIQYKKRRVSTTVSGPSDELEFFLFKRSYFKKLILVLFTSIWFGHLMYEGWVLLDTNSRLVGWILYLYGISHLTIVIFDFLQSQCNLISKYMKPETITIPKYIISFHTRKIQNIESDLITYFTENLSQINDKKTVKNQEILLLTACGIIFCLSDEIIYGLYRYQLVFSFVLCLILIQIYQIYENRNPFKLENIQTDSIKKISFSLSLLIFHETGIKLGFIIPQLQFIIETKLEIAIFSFIGYTCAIIILTIFISQFLKINEKRIIKTYLWIVILIIISLSMQIGSYFTTLGKFPFYFSIIELGPLF